MKTFVRLIRRYVLAAVGIVLLLLFSGVAVLGWLGWQESCRLPQREYSSSEIADSMVETAEGLAFGAERTPQEWMNGYEWAMVLDDVGNIRWSYGLPQDLNHAYTPGDIAKFARWYLADYPVFCWTEPYGLFVIGLPKGSLWKYSIYSSPDFALSMVRVLPAAALGLLMLGLVLCFWLSWRGAKRLETVANGLDALAQGQTVRLPTDGFAGELAEKLNQTGAQLQAKNEMLARRDNARTQWIAGVSHDVRTPLALILGWAEQLEQDALLPGSSRQKAAGIRTQCEKLRTLIDDLNLTSKLEYGAQPLRRKDLRAGPLFRQLVAQFCESPLLPAHQNDQTDETGLGIQCQQGLLQVCQHAVEQDLPDVAQQDAADQVGHEEHGTEDVGALDAAGQHQCNGKSTHIDKYSAYHGKRRRKAKGVQKGGILKYREVVLDAYKGGLGNGSEPLEGQVNAPDKGPDEADDKGDQSRKHKYRPVFTNGFLHDIPPQGAV